MSDRQMETCEYCYPELSVSTSGGDCGGAGDTKTHIDGMKSPTGQ